MILENLIIRTKIITMNIVKTEIDGVLIIEPRLFRDARGYFFESFSERQFEEKVTPILGHSVHFCQDNESMSSYGVMRGLHFQRPPYTQSKLVRCVKGRVLDVAVDIRKGSPTYVGKPTHRCVMRAEFGHEVAFGEDILTFTIEGNAFLHSMVRTIVGTLVEIGMHRRDPQWMREVIDACDRTAAGPTAPACGLTFMGVDYGPDELVVLD